ncbi:MAG: S8 family serine peptidase [Solirubrobacterales bacterium]
MRASSPRGRTGAALGSALAAAVVFGGAASAPARVPGGTALERPSPPTGRVLAILDRRGAGPIERLVERHDLRARQRVPAASLVAVAPGPGQGVAELREQLLADPLVKRVETEHYLQLRSVPNDPAYARPDPNAPNGDAMQWNLRRQDFEPAWSISNGSAAKVAIIDTGVSNTQPDLDHVVAAANFGSGTAGSDENGHGTHVAGLACADSSNGYGMASAGFDCRIAAEKLNVTGNSIDEGSLIAALYNAVDAQHADVINLSLGGGSSSVALRDAINHAWASNAVIVVAASNDQTSDQGYPARYVVPSGAGPNLATCPAGDTTSIGCSRGLVVTRGQYDDTNAAGYGSGISLAAYGDSSPLPAPYGLPGIFSTFPANQTTMEPLLCLSFPCKPRTSLDGDTRFAYLFGTSMAAPQVSGLAALIRSIKPGMSASGVILTIERTARGGGAWSSQLGFGIIDAGRALAVAAGKDITPPSSRVKSRRRSRSRRVKLKIARSDADPFGLSSGIDSVSVFVARGKRRFKLWRKTDKASIVFKGKRGKRYSFYSQAIDKAGNREADRAAADTVTRIRKRG